MTIRMSSFLLSSNPRCFVLLVASLAMFQAMPACGQSPNEEEQTKAALAGIPILPSKTDPEIKTFDFPHNLHVDRDIVVRHDAAKPAERHELLVWMTGTGGRSRGAEEFCTLAARQGYHVVKVMYPDDIPATICKRDKDPKSFEEFRLCIIAGGASPHITVTRADSIENRLIKLLAHLQKLRARENWGQFLTQDGGLQWEKLALAGQSQGGGHAFLMGMKHKVARVIGTGSPKDWSPSLNAPAPWLLAESATPKSRFFTFIHEQDYQGCTPGQQWEILKAFGLDAYGALTNVDKASPPYGNSRQLSTNHPGGKLESGPAHTSVAANKNAELFGPVWLQMLTAPQSEP